MEPTHTLRTSVQIKVFEGDERFPARLVDPELSQRIRLDQLGLRVAEELRKPMTLQQLLEAVNGHEDSVQRIVTMLDRFKVLDTESSRAFVETQARAQAMANADPATVPLLIRDDARFTCTMCGGCCGGQNVGPVSQEKVESLKPRFPILRDITGTKKPFFVDVPVTVDGERVERTICQTSKGSCVFLGKDRLCTIHGEFGGDAKPDVCQIFPYQFKATPEGIAVSLAMECRGFVEARKGRKLKDQEAELRGLIARHRVGTIRSVVALDERSTLAYDEVADLEASLHEAVDSHERNPSEALLAMRQVLENERESRGDERDDAEQFVRDLEVFQEDFLHSLGDLHDGYYHADERISVHTGSLDLLARAVVHLISDAERVILPLRRKDALALFREYAHHSLMGKELIRARHLVLGQARFAFSWFLVKAIAIDRARQVKRRHILAQDIQDALVIVHFVFRGEDAMTGLKRHDRQIVSLFHDRLPMFLNVAPNLALPNQPATLYKF